MPYLDTSVLTAYYCQEARSGHVQQMLSGIEQPAISRLDEVEFYCAVARLVRVRAMEKEAAVTLFAELRHHLDESRYNVLPVEPVHYDLAGEWITQLVAPLRAVDALHLAVAFTNDLPLLTADRDLARSAEYFALDHELIS